MCVLIHLSENLKPRQARGFQITFILIGCISILEMISVLVNDGPVWLRWLNILSNYLWIWPDTCSSSLPHLYIAIF